MKLIINADDFGKTKSINESVFELISIGSISSTSVMVNMPYANEAEALLQYSKISIGWHINISEGKSVLPKSQIPSLVDDNGNFYPKDILLSLIRDNKIQYKDLRAELFAQFNKLKSIIGNRLSHFDSHQGSLRISMVYKVLIEIIKKENIKVPIRVLSKYYLLNPESSPIILKPGLLNVKYFDIKRVLKELYFQFITKKRKKYFFTPDGMLFNKKNNTLSLLKDLKDLKSVPKDNLILEISCHPSKNINELHDTKMLEVRIEEYNLLRSEKFLSQVKNIGLLSFNDLYK